MTRCVNGMDGPDPHVAIIGCLTVDSVVTASGELPPGTCGGNSLYAAVGAYEHDGTRTRRIPDRTIGGIPEALRASFVDDTHDDARYLSATPTVEEIPAPWLASIRAVHLPPLLISSHRELIGALRVAMPGRLITVDSPWYDRRHATSTAHVDILSQIDAVLPSEEDLALFLPGVPLVAAARRLVEYGARAAVVKVGAAGSVVVDGSGEMTHVPAYPAHAVDPTGAGDSFCGGFLVGLRETGDLTRAALYGTVAASFVVEALAAIPVFEVQRAEADARLAVIEPLVRRDITDDPRGTRR